MVSMLNKWKQGLAKTSKSAFGQISSLLGVTEVTDEIWEDLEDLLIQSDLGVETSESILESLWERERREGITTTNELSTALYEELRKRLDKPPTITLEGNPSVIIVVGVNGSGKTTTIAKLGKRFSIEGKQVLLGAADTYRAAAVDQLEIWAKRAGLPIISGQPGGDPGAVAYDAVQSAKSRGYDVLILDTAGRLHTRHNLMEELKKVNRVVTKAHPGAPHHVWLVMDATTGQNALQQARAFKEAVDVTGVILAKLDSSARGGMVFAIQHDLNLPILFAGLGESLDDLEPFDPNAFLNGILKNEIH
jgi:fused signal recognition particle receptor